MPILILIDVQCLQMLFIALKKVWMVRFPPGNQEIPPAPKNLSSPHPFTILENPDYP